MIAATILLGLALMPQSQGLSNGGPVHDTEIGQTLQMENQDSIEETERRTRIQNEADERQFVKKVQRFVDAWDLLMQDANKGIWNPRQAARVDKLYHEVMKDSMWSMMNRKKK